MTNIDVDQLEQDLEAARLQVIACARLCRTGRYSSAEELELRTRAHRAWVALETALRPPTQ